jgi:hypothetical protein
MTMKVFTHISLSLLAGCKEEKQAYIPCMSYFSSLQSANKDRLICVKTFIVMYCTRSGTQGEV